MTPEMGIFQILHEIKEMKYKFDKVEESQDFIAAQFDEFKTELQQFHITK
jgi:hypothetical protein